VGLIIHPRMLEANIRASDIVFFFGYVQLSSEERKYSAANRDSAQKLADINGEYNMTILSNFEILT
jgi:hypothetical protein